MERDSEPDQGIMREPWMPSQASYRRHDEVTRRDASDDRWYRNPVWFIYGWIILSTIFLLVLFEYY